MTVALVLAGKADAGLCGQLAALGVRRVDAAEQTGAGLLTVAAAARAAGERVLICVGADTVPEPVLARLLRAGGTTAFARVTAGALVVDVPDLDALALAAETLAATHAGPGPGVSVGALISELNRRGVTVRILDAGPDSEGAVAQLMADPAARDMARWAAWRRLTPAALYGISLGLGLVAAVWFAELAVRAKLAAVAALAASFLVARAGSLLAATSRDGRIRPVVSWLGTACGLLTELAIYAALAVSSGVAPLAPLTPLAPPGPPAGVVGLDGTFGDALWQTFVASWGGAGTTGVWRLAIAALLVLGIRRMAELGYEHTARVSGNLFPRSVLRILEQAVTFPAGERYAVIAVTAVFFGPRLTFVVLLGWGVLAAGYVLAGQVARSAGPARLAGEAGRARRRRAGGLPRRRHRVPLVRRAGPGPAAAASAGARGPVRDVRPGGPRAREPVRHLAADADRGDDARRPRRAAPARRTAGLAGARAADGGRVRVPGRPRPVPSRGRVAGLRAAGGRGHAPRRPGLPGPGLPGHPGGRVRPGLGRTDAAGRRRRRGRPRAIRLRPAFGISLGAFHLGLPQRVAGTCRPGSSRPGAHGRRRRLIGMVLAAGAGRRLRPDTDALPKALLPVDGQVTILDIALRNLAAVGLRDIVIVVGYAAGAVRDRAAALERAHGVRLTLVDNDRAEEWNNAYSLWLAREHFAAGALLVNGDTVHPVTVEKTLLAAAGQAGIVIAVDDVKRLADEEMKVIIDPDGRLTRITKLMDPALAYGEYIGATLIGAPAAAPLAAALEATWRRDPSLYYEDGYQELADRGGVIEVAPIGEVEWVEVDNHDDLRRAREIAARC